MHEMLVDQGRIEHNVGTVLAKTAYGVHQKWIVPACR